MSLFLRSFYDAHCIVSISSQDTLTPLNLA